jgi:hypothetical protein
MITKDGWDDIISRTKQGEVKTISWAYRKDWERDIYDRLARRGLFTVKRSRGLDVYTPTDKPYAKELNPKVTYHKGHEIVN